MGARPVSGLLCACGAALALAAIPAAAVARRMQATFAVTAEGTQTVAATLRGEPEGCADGRAHEQLRFAARPVRVRIQDTGPLLELSGLSARGEDGRQPFAAGGTVTRSASGAFICRLPPETPPDCGTKPFAGLPMLLQGSSLRRGRLTLSVSLQAEGPPDVFSSCPVQHAYPAVFAGEVPHVRTTAATLFDRARRTIVLRSNRLTSSEIDGSASHTAMTLQLTLRRL